MAEIESEKKRLIDKIPDHIDLKNTFHQEITQFYIRHPIFGGVRMRSIDNTVFLITKKHNNKNIIGKVEIEEEITAEEFETNKQYIIKNNHGEIKKTRYHIDLGENIIGELDIFHEGYDGIIFLEIEFENIHQYTHFKKPNRFGKNISGIVSNKSLFLKGPAHAQKHNQKAEEHTVVKKVKKVNRSARRKLLKLHNNIKK